MTRSADGGPPEPQRQAGSATGCSSDEARFAVWPKPVISTNLKFKAAVNALRNEVAAKIHQHGALGAMRVCATKLFRKIRAIGLKGQEVHPFDLKYGTDTGGVVLVGALDIPAERMKHAVRYQTALVDVFEAILAVFAIPYEQFVFVDLGSGKGRALLLASRYPFKAVIGIELSPALHGIACRNIKTYRDDLQKCRQITCICGDATTYQIPDENAVFYLFNPFDEEIIEMVWKNIEFSLARSARKVFIAYLKPVHRHVFDRSPILKVLRQTERFVIYETNSVH